MRSLVILMLTACLFVRSFGQKAEQFSRAKVFLDTNGHNIKSLSALGVAVDHGEYKKNTFFVTDFSASELERIKAAGFKIEIIYEDVSKHYREQNKKKDERVTSGLSCALPSVGIPSHFHLGSYAGFFTYTEMLTILDSMHILYPGVISARMQIDTFRSIQDSPIYYYRVSNHPTLAQPGKPQVLYTALHHAREPGCLSSTIYFLWYLLENYASDAKIQSIVNNEELYVVPCLNPDGYIYNITTNPAGGGLWRKNMRDNLDGTFGVDLNRNYGYEWGYDDIGSSPITSYDTYRGDSGFSEPETRAIRWLCENHDFKINLNYHTFNNDIIYPWGYIGSYNTTDSSLFFAYASFLTQDNHYRFGTSNETVNYTANGTSDDWMYGDTTDKNKIFGMTPEVGFNSYGFYPPTSQIIPDCKDNLLSNVNLPLLLLPCAEVISTDNNILIHSSGYVHYNIQRVGLPDSESFSVTAISLDSRLTFTPTVRYYSGLSLLQQVSDSLPYSIATGTPNGQSLSCVLKISNGYYDTYDTVQFYYGKHYAITTPSTATLTDWTTYGWNICTATYFTPPSSIKSSLACADNYPDNADNYLQLNNPVDLTHALQANLQFEAKWSIESTYDYVDVSASTDGGSTWNLLCGKYTKNGTSYQAYDQPIYDGQQPLWVLEQMDLSDYLGHHVLLKFELISDPYINYDGFYVDDVVVTAVIDSATKVEQVSTANTEFNCFPNPASNQLNIHFSGTIDRKLPLAGAIIDCLGRKVKSFLINAATEAVDVSALPDNIYYIKIEGIDKGIPVITSHNN